MLVRPFPKLFFVVVVPCIIYSYFVWNRPDGRSQETKNILSWVQGSRDDALPTADDLEALKPLLDSIDQAELTDHLTALHKPKGGIHSGSKQPYKLKHGEVIIDESVYRRVSSVSTTDKKYFRVRFGDRPSLNPNILPHPSKRDTWIMVAQEVFTGNGDLKLGESVENVCNAAFRNGELVCSDPVRLPIKPTNFQNCHGDLWPLKGNVGPHDARVFHGPDVPYTIFGSNSGFTCFGQWVQDLRYLLPGEYGVATWGSSHFQEGTELQRPPPIGAMEKNWFLFWDIKGNPYAHYDISPKRVFGQLQSNGSAGPDLAPRASANDETCMAIYMPAVSKDLESIHQATNSLLITLCKRSDPSCRVSPETTFIMTVFQHKSFYKFHSVYEPYVMLFKWSAPFEIHAIGKKPIWINGRGALTTESAGPQWDSVKKDIPLDQTEMFYVTSISWRNHGMKYHGYADDVMFMNFGIEDGKAAAIDILAGDLLLDLGLCHR